MVAVPADGKERHYVEILGVDEPLKVYSISGYEGLSENYRIDVTVAMEAPQLDPRDLLEKAIVLKIGDDHFNVRRFIHGIIFGVEIETPGHRYTLIKITLGPRLELLAYRRNQRIFQEQTAQKIIETLLGEAQLTDYRFALQGNLEERLYCVQYQETDLEFIQRLLQEEGLYYYYEHSKETHTLVITDGAGGVTAIPEPSAIPYHAPGGTNVADDNAIHPFYLTAQVQSDAVALQDYEYQKPSLNLYNKQEGPVSPYLQDYQYPGRYPTPETGQKLVKQHLEQHQWQRLVAQGSSDRMDLVIGYKFSLTSHPQETLNQDYHIIRLELDIKQPQVVEEGLFQSGDHQAYARNTFHVIPADIPYRSPQNKDKPRIDSIQTAVVVGPAGEEIYTDEQGRIKVQFHWDREGEYNETASCWIRCAQDRAGAGWGQLYLPRIGQEVVIQFVEGDPDRPLITGSVYHGENRTPYALPAEKTKSTIKTNSSKGGKGFNELRIEDLKGEEQIFVHAQKDLDKRILNDSRSWIGNDDDHIITNNQLEKIQGKQEHHVMGDRMEKIDSSLHRKIDQHQHTKVGKLYAHDVGKELHLDSGQKIVMEGGSEVTLKAGSGWIKISPSGVDMGGPQIKINTGGGAGSGGGASPLSPIDILPAVNAIPGTLEKIPAQNMDITWDHLLPETDFATAWIEVEVKDQDGNLVENEPMEIVLANGQSVVRQTNDQGRLRLDGIPEGQCEIKLINHNKIIPGGDIPASPASGPQAKQKKLSRLSWLQDRVPVGEPVELEFYYQGFEGGEEATINVYELDSDGNHDLLDTLTASLENPLGSQVLEWTRTEEETEADLLEEDGDTGPLEYGFEVSIGGIKQFSENILNLTTCLEIDAEDELGGEAMDDGTVFCLLAADGEERFAEVENGKLIFEDVVVGPVELTLFEEEDDIEESEEALFEEDEPDEDDDDEDNPAGGGFYFSE